MSTVDINAQRDLSIAGDVVGRDKITHHHHYAEKKERPIPRMAPPAPRVFIGRDEVLRELIAALKLGEDGAGPIALTALKGMGGIGKTTLAAALANHPEVETALPEGTFWAGLGPEPEVMSLLAEWGAQLGEDFAQLDSPEARSRRLSTLLHDKKALLIVDDIWQAETARYFLVGGPHCRALITTRDNEIARKLAGHEAVRVQTLNNAASLNLLRELAPEAVAADENAANELATALDGLPLALTLAGQMLAAEWEAGLGVAGALSELKNREARLKLAGAERAGLATDEFSLRAILAMSYDRLPDEVTKRAFRLLGVFGGKPLTFSIEAAAAVWGMELRPAQKTMVALVGRALVESVDGGRYTLHTTLADFAESLLEKHGEVTFARHGHAKYYLEFARAIVKVIWLAVEVEMGQIRKGFQTTKWLMDKMMLLDYFWTLNGFFDRRGLWDEWMNWAETALDMVCSTGDRKTEAALLNDVGRIYFRRGKLDEALKFFERSRIIFQQVGDQVGLAVALTNIGRIYCEKKEWNKAIELLQRSREFREENRDREGLEFTLYTIGYVHLSKGNLDEALKYFERYYAFVQERGDREIPLLSTPQPAASPSNRIILADALHNIGRIYEEKDELDNALSYFKRSLAIWEEVGDRNGFACTLWHIGIVYERQIRLVDAVQVLTQAVAIFEELGSSKLEDARKQLDKVKELQRMASQK